MLTPSSSLIDLAVSASLNSQISMMLHVASESLTDMYVFFSSIAIHEY